MARDRRPWRTGQRPHLARQGPRSVTVAKSPGVAAVLSFFICGLGQIYNGQILKGFVFMLAFALCVLSITIVIGVVLTPVMWLVGIVDAYKAAEAINRAALAP